MSETIATPITQMFNITHPIMLAGMNVAAGPKLAAAVTNAGGLGVIGGVGYTPKMLRKQIAELKSFLNNKNAPVSVCPCPRTCRTLTDLAVRSTAWICCCRRSEVAPGEACGAGIALSFEEKRCADCLASACRATNTDYTKGQLPELIDVIIEEKASLFVCAVGVPPRWAVDKLHAANIPVMNMIGAPKHCVKALAAGVDLICAQGGEGGGVSRAAAVLRVLLFFMAALLQEGCGRVGYGCC